MIKNEKKEGEKRMEKTNLEKENDKNNIALFRFAIMLSKL